MKRLTKLLILLAGLLVVGVAALAAVRLTQAPETEVQGEFIVFEAPEDSFVQFAIRYDGETMDFTNRDGMWVYDADPQMPLTQRHFEKMIRELTPLKAVNRIGAQQDLAAYGLDQPKVSFTATTTEKSIAIRVGNESALGNERYFMVDDGTIYSGSKDLLGDFDNTLLEYIAPEDIPDLSRTYGLKIVRRDETIELLCESKDGTSKWFLSSGGGGIELDYEETSAFVDTILDMAWKKTAAWKPSAEVLETMGLALDAAEVTITYLDSSLTVCEYVVCIGGDGNGAYYAQPKDSFQVHQIDYEVGNAIFKASFRSGIKVD